MPADAQDLISRFDQLVATDCECLFKAKGQRHDSCPRVHGIAAVCGILGLKGHDRRPPEKLRP
jgi:hypothetical protein